MIFPSKMLPSKAPSSSNVVQMKLRVNQPGGCFEQQVNQIADQDVSDDSGLAVSSLSPLVQGTPT